MWFWQHHIVDPNARKWAHWYVAKFGMRALNVVIYGGFYYNDTV